MLYGSHLVVSAVLIEKGEGRDWGTSGTSGNATSQRSLVPQAEDKEIYQI